MWKRIFSGYSRCRFDYCRSSVLRFKELNSGAYNSGDGGNDSSRAVDQTSYLRSKN